MKEPDNFICTFLHFAQYRIQLKVNILYTPTCWCILQNLLSYTASIFLEESVKIVFASFPISFWEKSIMMD